MYSKRRLEVCIEDAVERVAKVFNTGVKVVKFARDNNCPIYGLEYTIAFADNINSSKIAEYFSLLSDMLSSPSNIVCAVLNTNSITLSVEWVSFDWSYQLELEDTFVNKYFSTYNINSDISRDDDREVLKGNWSWGFLESFPVNGGIG